MAPIHRILVPLDFSPHSERALGVAAALAERARAPLVLVHAYQLPAPVTPLGGGPPQAETSGLEQTVRASASGELERRARALQERSLHAESLVVEGSPSDAICRTVTDAGADLVVMGTRGRSGLAHFLLGSAAERTVRAAPCPVLTCSARDEDDGGAAAPFAPRRILAAVDFSEPAERALGVAAEWSRWLEAELVLVHVVPEDDAGDGRERLDALAGRVGDGARARPRARQEVGTPAEAIVRAAADEAADLVVMGTRGRSGLAHVVLGSAAERTLRTAPCPVLTVHRAEEGD